MDLVKCGQKKKKLTIGIRGIAYNDNLRQARIDAGYETARAFANDLGMGEMTVGAYERMQLYPGLETAMKISELLKRDVEYLFPEILKNISKKKIKSFYLKRDFYYGDADNQVESDIDREWFLEDMSREMEGLSAREKEVLDKRFNHGMTLRDIGKSMGVTAERIQQVECRVIRRLKRGEVVKDIRKEIGVFG